MQNDILYALQQLRETLPSFVSLFFGGLSNFVGGVGAIALILVIYWCVSKRNGTFLMLAVLLAMFIGQTIKNIACIYRPWIFDARLYVAEIAREGASGYSFPSVHTAVAVAAFCGIAFLLWNRHRAWSIVSGIVALLVAFGRAYLGCHTLVDVLAGAVIGVLGIALAYAIVRYVEGKPEMLARFCAAGAFVVIATLIYTSVKSYPLDYDATGKLLVDPWDMQIDCYRCAGALLAQLLAWPLEERFVGFSTSASTKALVVRGVAGVVFAVALYAGVLPVLALVLDSHWYYFTKYFILLAILVVGYPACFARIEKSAVRAPRSFG